MPDILTQRNIGALLAPPTPSVYPQSASAGTISGSSIDRAAHLMSGSCVLEQQLGAISGAPSAVSIVSTLQHAPDNATWTTYIDPSTGNAATTAALTAADSANSLNVDLSLAYRYIRVQTVVGFTGGTSPAALIAAKPILAGEPENPAV